MSPVENMLQTTIIAPSATDSDALSTATFVMGPEASALSSALVSALGGSIRRRYFTGSALQQRRLATSTQYQQRDSTRERKLTR